MLNQYWFIIIIVIYIFLYIIIIVVISFFLLEYLSWDEIEQIMNESEDDLSDGLSED